jgi:hypothetical protein
VPSNGSRIPPKRAVAPVVMWFVAAANHSREIKKKRVKFGRHYKVAMIEITWNVVEFDGDLSSFL